MPIRINLLAEAQIAEDLRRRDPVKRAIITGAFLVVLALVWSSSLQLAVMISKRDLTQVQEKIESRTNEWQNVLIDQKKVYNARAKLASLRQLSANRFLQGNFMNALQQLNLDGVQLMRVRLAQTCLTVDAVPSTTNANHVVELGHLAMITQKIAVSLDARDISANPGDQVNKFKEAVASQAYFKSTMNTTNGVQLISLSPPQNGADGKPYVLFTLECDITQPIR
jgi:hypothetical protein